MSTLSVAQNDKAYVELLVSNFTSELESKGINTYFYRYEYCDGHMEMFTLNNGKTCMSKGAYYKVYVIWKKDDNAMIKKIDNCGTFNKLSLNNGNLTDFVGKNSKQLEQAR